MRTTTILIVGVITCKNGDVELIKISLPTLVYPPFVVYNKKYVYRKTTNFSIVNKLTTVIEDLGIIG